MHSTARAHAVPIPAPARRAASPDTRRQGPSQGAARPRAMAIPRHRARGGGTARLILPLACLLAGLLAGRATASPGGVPSPARGPATRIPSPLAPRVPSSLAPRVPAPALSSTAARRVPGPGAYGAWPLAGRDPDLVAGRPTVSASLLDRVLADYGSPMAGEGRDLYRLGVRHGIDPAFALAFFIHESAAGTRGEATLTRNLGNIRAVPGAPSRDGYRAYGTWLEGADHWYRLIGTLYVGAWKLRTISAIVPVYAPSGDSNDPAAYIDDVRQLVAAWRAQAATGT